MATLLMAAARTAATLMADGRRRMADAGWVGVAICHQRSRHLPSGAALLAIVPARPPERIEIEQIPRDQFEAGPVHEGDAGHEEVRVARCVVFVVRVVMDGGAVPDNEIRVGHAFVVGDAEA